jgi:hypothetical protein
LLRRSRRGDHDKAVELIDAALATANQLGLKALAHKTQRLRRQAATKAAP